MESMCFHYFWILLIFLVCPTICVLLQPSGRYTKHFLHLARLAASWQRNLLHVSRIKHPIKKCFVCLPDAGQRTRTVEQTTKQNANELKTTKIEP